MTDRPGGPAGESARAAVDAPPPISLAPHVPELTTGRVAAVVTAQRTRSFARGLWRVAAADVSSGNQVQLLRDGPATFDAMPALIVEARERIAFEGYIFRDDEVGERFRDALIEAARSRGPRATARGLGREDWGPRAASFDR